MGFCLDNEASFHESFKYGIDRGAIDTGSGRYGTGIRLAVRIDIQIDLYVFGVKSLSFEKGAY